MKPKQSSEVREQKITPRQAGSLGGKWAGFMFEKTEAGNYME